MSLSVSVYSFLENTKLNLHCLLLLPNAKTDPYRLTAPYVIGSPSTLAHMVIPPRVADVLSDYLGGPNEDLMKDNFIIVYELYFCW
ncbi:hypothetical protein PanWU01x14_123110 [Parasponia andersonii]|uniref:Uncharacterized protein n=1 Tax=Parasponia andersonii TaxID=3476 RepID=A0A2P5CU84_PARAD|nr:hypothetical protein PanWU01x14_123110 [Parasponia andersonii]